MATKNSINSNDPIEVALGGTGNATLTSHGVLVGAGTSAITQLSVGASSTVLQGSTGADPAFTATPTVTSITLGSGSALSTNVDWTSFTPTVDGATPGTTTYTTQIGYYARIGNVVYIFVNIVTSAATGTGNLMLGGLPYTVHAGTGLSFYTGSAYIAGLTWPASTTQIFLRFNQNSTNGVFLATGSVASGAVQIANAAFTVEVTGFYWGT